MNSDRSAVSASPSGAPDSCKLARSARRAVSYNSALGAVAPAGWIPLTQLAASPRYPGATEKARGEALRRAAVAASSAGNARRYGGKWYFAPEAQLGGRQAQAWLLDLPAQLAGRTLPAGHADWSQRDRARFIATAALLDAWTAFQTNRFGRVELLAPAFAAAPLADHCPELARSVDRGLTVGAYFERVGLSIDARRLREYRRRLAVDGNVDRRGRRAGDGVELPDERLRECYRERCLHPNFYRRVASGWAPMHRQAWRDTRDLAQALGLSMRSPGWWRTWFNQEHPKFARDYARSPRDFEAGALPKIERDNTPMNVAPLDWVVLDGHVLNIEVQLPGRGGAPRRKRVTLTGVVDLGTRRFVGHDIRGDENSDGILAGLKMMHREVGCARHYYADNGTAYKASIGHRVRRVLFEDPRIANICQQTGGERHNAIPYHGWAKLIESLWNTVIDRFERYWGGAWFGNIGARPDDAGQLRADQLPTLADVRAAWLEFLRGYHAEPQDALSGLTPNLAAEQHAVAVRKLDADVLTFLCQRFVGPRTVGRDGVSYNGVRYGHFDESVWKLIGDKVWLGIDPDQAETVWLCDHELRPLALASNRRLTGTTPEDIREAAQRRSRMRKIARDYAACRDFLLDSNIQQIMQVRADAAEFREAQQRAALPPAPEVAATLVRSDLVAPVRAARREADRDRRRLTGRSARPSAENPSSVAQALAEMLDDDDAACGAPSQMDLMRELADAG